MRTAIVTAYSEETRSSMAVFSADKKQRLLANLDEVFTLQRCQKLAKMAAELDPRNITRISIEDYDRKKKYCYNIVNNCLTIYSAGMPIYENNNGTICNDQAALADCLL